MRAVVTWMWPVVLIVAMAGCGGDKPAEQPDASAGAGKPQTPQDRASRLENLNIVGLAMHNYRDTYGHFPYVDHGPRPEDPNRGLSWRVYLAPYADARPQYEQMNRNEPWDSEQNRQLISQIPDAYNTPGVDEGKTTVHVFVGENAPFGHKEPLTITSISDGLPNTILAVQAGPEKAAEWTRPGGLEFDPENPKRALGTIPAEGLYVVFFDSSVRLLRKDIPDELLTALITPNGGEEIDPDQIEEYIVQ